MITLYTFGPYFGLPDPSPFVMKAEMLLKLSGLEYETNKRGFRTAPKGKLPYIRDGATVVADSTLIRLYLEQKHSIYFDRGLSPQQRGTAWAVEKMLEDHLYWVMVYWRWMVDSNYERGPRNFFRRFPALLRPFIAGMVRRRVRRNLHGHGIGRHSEAEMSVMASRAVDALSQVLGDNEYFLGPEPCGADATVFAFVASSCTKTFESPLRAKLESTPNLAAYHDRMMKQFFPQFAGR